MEAQFQIYSVKNDPETQKLLDILDQCEVPYVFRDFRDYPPQSDQIEKWAEYEGSQYPINLRSTFFKKNKKNFDRLSDSQKKDWLSKNYIALLRPIIEDDNGTVLSIGGRPERLAKIVFGLEKE